MKAANSPWRCNDRGNAWLKIKPDYLQVRRSNLLCRLSCLIGPWESTSYVDACALSFTC